MSPGYLWIHPRWTCWTRLSAASDPRSGCFTRRWRSTCVTRAPATAHQLQSQSRLTEVLLAHVPRTADGHRDWSRADEYTRTYLPTHAASGGVLDTLLDEAGFLATAEPGRLLAALPTANTSRGIQIARIVERVGQQLLRSPREEQVCYLEMAARMAGDDALANDLAAFAPDRPWSVPWARWEPLHDGRFLGHHNDWIAAVRTVDTGHGIIVVSASDWTIRAWSLVDGSPVASGLSRTGLAGRRHDLLH